MEIALFIAVIGALISLCFGAAAVLLRTASKRDVEYLEGVNDGLRDSVCRIEMIAREASQRAEALEERVKDEERQADFNHQRVVQLQTQLIQSDARHAQLTVEKEKIAGLLAAREIQLKYYHDSCPGPSPAGAAVLEALRDMGETPAPSAPERPSTVPGQLYDPMAVPQEVSDAAELVKNWFMQNTAQRGWAYKGICDRWYVSQYDVGVRRLRAARQRLGIAEGTVKDAQVERDQAVHEIRKLTETYNVTVAQLKDTIGGKNATNEHLRGLCAGLEEASRRRDLEVASLRNRLSAANVSEPEDQVGELRMQLEQAVTDSRARKVKYAELEFMLARAKTDLHAVRGRCTELSEGLAQMQRIKDERVVALEHEVYKWTTIASQLRNRDANTSFTYSMTPWTVFGTQPKATA